MDVVERARLHFRSQSRRPGGASRPPLAYETQLNGEAAANVLLKP
jgi:hypothetical protein